MAATWVAFSSASASATSVVVPAPTGLAADDHQLLIVGMSGGTTETVTTPAGWTPLAAVNNTTDPGPYQTRTYISSTDVGSVTVTKSGTTAVHVVRAAWRGGPGFDVATAGATAGTTSTTAHALQSVTTTSEDSLVVAVLHADSGSAATSWTAPAGWTERVDVTALVGRSIGVFEIVRATPGTQTGTATANRADYYNTVGVALSGVTVIPIAPDSGDGVDTITVDQTEIRDLIEEAPSADPITVLAVNDVLADSGASTETIIIDQLVDVFVTDAGGVGADTIAVADFKGNDLIEAAPSTDTIGVVQTNFADLTEAPPGVDSITLQQQLSLADSGASVETLSFVVASDLVDSGVGVDEISIVVIPFTAEQRLAEGTVYDLVVVARVPQESGPPTFIEVDPIEWKSLTYSNTLKEPQTLTASCLISSVPESIWQRLRALHELATELWLYRNGERVFAGPLQGWQTSGEDLQLSCKGLLQYLRSMVVHTNQVFSNVDQFTIVKALVDQWQNLPYGNFGIDTSQISASGQLRKITYLRDELHVVGTRVEELGKLATGFDAEVDPASRELQLWSPSKGVDRSFGEDAIIFDARNITSGDILCSVAGGDLASEAYGNAGSAGSDGALFAIRSNDELRARYGRTGVTGSFANEQSQTALNDYVQGLLDARAQVLLVPGPRCRVTPDADLSAYAVGDSISYDLAEQLGINQAFRIRKQTVTVSSTGQESVDLEFV